MWRQSLVWLFSGLVKKSFFVPAGAVGFWVWWRSFRLGGQVVTRLGLVKPGVVGFARASVRPVPVRPWWSRRL
jgi:hypothetical protein